MPLDHPGNPALFRLAEWLADPVRWHRGGDGLPEDLRSELGRSPDLRPALNDWLAAEEGLAAVPLDAAFIADLAVSEETGLAVALLTESDERLEDIARFFGAALWADRLRQTVLRTERDRLAEQLGAEAMAFGLRRAPVLARALADMPLARTAPDPVTAGYALCGALIARARPVLFDLFRLRLPGVTDPITLTDRQAQAAWAILALRGTMP